MMSDEQLQNLYYLGETYTVCQAAHSYIEELEQKLCNKADYIAILREALDDR